MLQFFILLNIIIKLAFSNEFSPEFKVEFKLNYLFKNFNYLTVRLYDNYGDGSSEGWKSKIEPEPIVMV